MYNISEYPSLITITDAIPPNFCKYIVAIFTPELSTHN
jgi:hypothetical protein